MLTTTFSINSADLDSATDLHLVIEIAQEHIACILQRDGGGIAAIEMLRYTDNDAADFDELLSQLMQSAPFLRGKFNSTTVYINLPNVVVVPAFKFNKDIAGDYLQLVVGSLYNTTRYYDLAGAGNDMMIVYAVPDKWTAALQQSWPSVKFRHSYSRMIETAIASDVTGECLFLQFYHNRFLLCALQDKKLILIQTFDFVTPDDVCYQLLNACNQLDLSGPDLALHVSGLIDSNSSLYRELVKYFHNVHLDTVESALLPAAVNGHPSHYFTPFYKLAQ